MAGQTWNDLLQEGTFGGVRFDFVSTKDDHSNDLDKQRFPNRPGQFVKPRGRNGTSFDVLAVFIEDDYPDTMDKLIAQLDDGGIVKKFVHPVFGSFQAACERFTVVHNVEDAIDSATIQISFVEHTDNTGGPKAVSRSVPAKANAVRSLADQVFTTLTTVQNSLDVINSDIGLQIVGAVNAASSVADSFEATGDELSALAIQSTANGALAAISTVIDTLADYTTEEEYNISQALLALSAALFDLATVLLEGKPFLQERAVLADTNLLSLVFDLYGSSDRVDEVLALNTFPDPSLIPAGFKILAYAE